MAKIKQLSPEEIQKIAAGEVVERPANVVKELVENALDAGATTITLHAEHGGKALIRLTDNGSGMSPEDLRMCIEHHATSKITSVNDLATISTFGFRGEALSSIAAVSRLTITSKTRDTIEGNSIALEGSRVLSQKPAAATDGTDIVITDLFYNVPARRKFLKTDETEWRAIMQLMQAYTLANLSISFKVLHNNRLMLQAPATTNLTERLRAVFDQNWVEAAVTCVPKTHTGFSFPCATITNTHFKRYDRSQIFFFVNNRWVKNAKLSSALVKGYGGVLPAGRFPAAVIKIDVDPGEVDVNIHPRKEEVQFLHPRRVEVAIQEMVTSALAEYTTGMFKTNYIPLESTPISTTQITESRVTIDPEKTGWSSQTFNTPRIEFSPFKTPGPFLTQPESFEPTSSLNAPLKNTPEQTPNVSANPLITQPTYESLQATMHNETEAYTLIGQLARTYILIEQKDGLLLIDQHAAHERFLYETFEHRFENIATVSLIFPTIITVSEAEAETLATYQHLFANYGVEIEQVGPYQFAVKATPVMLKNKDLNDLIKSTLSLFSTIKHADSQTLTKELHHAMRAQMACKAAVKAGDTLTHTQMRELINNLNTVNNRFSCPHGRPTTYTITTNEIERKFKRKL